MNVYTIWVLCLCCSKGKFAMYLTSTTPPKTLSDQGQMWQHHSCCCGRVPFEFTTPHRQNSSSNNNNSCFMQLIQGRFTGSLSTFLKALHQILRLNSRQAKIVRWMLLRPMLPHRCCCCCCNTYATAILLLLLFFVVY